MSTYEGFATSVFDRRADTSLRTGDTMRTSYESLSKSAVHSIYRPWVRVLRVSCQYYVHRHVLLIHW